MLSSTASARFWNSPELKVYVGKALSTQRDLLHFAQTNKATCALLLPLLYENICVAIDHISQIQEMFTKYPEYARQCKQLRVECPDKIERSYLEGKTWRDKGVVVDFQLDPARRFDAEFAPDWEDETDYSTPLSVLSDPIEWVVHDEEYAAQVLDQVYREARWDAGESGDEEFVSDQGDDDVSEDENRDEEDGGDERDEDEESRSPYTRRKEKKGSGQVQATGSRPNRIPMLAYWRTTVEKHKHDTSRAWLKKKDLIDNHITNLHRRRARKRDGPVRLRNACDALARVLVQLSESGRLLSFEWVWETSEDEVWPIAGASGELWAAVEKNAPSLQKLVLKLFPEDRKTWVRRPSFSNGLVMTVLRATQGSFPSTNYQSLKILHLNLANVHKWFKARLLTDMLEQLSALEALHIKLPWLDHVKDFTLTGTYPKLRYFSWESGGSEPHPHGGADSSRFFQRNLAIDTLHISCTSRNPFTFSDTSILPHLRAVSYCGHLRPDLIPLGDIVSRRPVVIVRSKLPAAGLLAFVRLPVAASATVQWLDVKYHSNFRLDLAAYGEALRAVPHLRELTIRTRSGRFDGRLTPLDVPDVLTAIPHDHPLTALTLYDPDGDALTASDLEDLSPISPHLKYLGWETSESRVLYALEKQGDKTVAKEIPYPRKQSWVWTQNSILDHSDGELWTDPFEGEVIPGLSQF
ncbi:hypothetical protein EIP86_009036 [Pleurotus ostreatoroseus]|nr:hypothetical protein EIP86_009036 [Pleurotus ostreatoroseus]